MAALPGLRAVGAVALRREHAGGAAGRQSGGVATAVRGHGGPRPAAPHTAPARRQVSDLLPLTQHLRDARLVAKPSRHTTPS